MTAAPHRVAVTGLGVVTPVGSTVDEMWASLVAGRSGVDDIRHFDVSTFPTRFAAQVGELAADRVIGDPALRALLTRKDTFGWIAANDALNDAGVLVGARPARIGVSIGTEARRPEFLQRLATRTLYRDCDDHFRDSPFTLAGALAREHDLAGPQFTVATACTSGTQAVGVAFEKIRRGEADAMLTGGCDSLIDPTMLTGFSLLGALSTRNDDPPRASRPFDLHRDGFVLGEGAGMLVLERLDLARRRGARVYGEVLGYASSSNAYRITDSPPDGGGPYLAMKNAIADAGLAPDDIDYINAHGTSTVQNDRSETVAIKRCLGDRARQVPVSSTKSMIGHLVTAGGAVELIVCLLTIAHGVITPTINYETPDPDCDLDYVPNVARSQDVARALSNSFGFGGINATVIVGRTGA